jgi:multidrug transporter EmrE-like cation transporter
VGWCCSSRFSSYVVGNLVMVSILLLIPASAWLLISALIDTFSEYASKVLILSHNWQFIIIVVTASMASSVLWLPALLHKNKISIMGPGWLLLKALSVLMVAIFIFHEHISFTQTLGIGLAIIAMILLGT